MTTQETDALRAFFDRRHPEYNAKALHWRFLRACYDGGREWFLENIFKGPKEGEDEFDSRIKRAYRFNHTREVVDLVQKYLFKADIVRREDASPTIKAFWKSSTLNGLGIDQLMRQVSTLNSVGGRVALVIDNNLTVDPTAEAGKSAVSVAAAKKNKSRIYAYTVPVEDILDYAFDEDGDGRLIWIKLRERYRDDADPLNSTGDIELRVRLWTRTEWKLFVERDIPQENTGKRDARPARKVVMIDEGKHDLGVVPVILCDHSISGEPYKAPGLIDDIAYLDRAITNYLSNLDAIIQDQTFSQLAIPAGALSPTDDLYNKVLELGTKRIFIYDNGQGAAKPEYISPDPKQAGVILTVISKIINEIYHTIGLAGERTKEDNSQGIDNSSGVAKAYDFERVNSLLISKAGSCERAENEANRIVSLWAGETPPEENLVTYPVTFDVMRLADDLVTAEALGKIMAPAEVRREQMRLLIDKLFPRLTDDIRASMEPDIKKWLGAEDIQLNPPSSFSGAKPVAAPSRQGQVTPKTPKKPAVK